ncbi:MAG: hypothetical protein JST16_10305 [Bdellovibrionales bacterium]|nr:hypothetical protein [Bdellovibrionales bacterium]
MRSGFTIIKNGDSLGYPWTESIRSLAPLVDEIVVAHGDSTDSTGATLRALAAELACPLVIVESSWDASNTRGGSELARQTNIALDACRHDVCFYLQSDEVLADTDTEQLRADLVRFESDPSVDALALTWVHFYGTFDTYVHSKRWYRREVRVIKKSRGLRSYGDAQGFRIARSSTWTKPRAALSRARCLHYGWVRPPEVMARKSETLDRLWHGSAKDGTHVPALIYPPVYGLRPFTGTHPAVMRERIAQFKRDFPNFDPFGGYSAPVDGEFLRLYFTDIIESLTGWRPGEFRNYRLCKRY